VIDSPAGGVAATSKDARFCRPISPRRSQSSTHEYRKGVDATCPHEPFHRSKDSYSALDHKDYLQTLSFTSYDVLHRHRVRALQSHILVRHIHPEYLR